MRGDGHATGATTILPESVTSPRRRVTLPLKPTGRTLETFHEIRLLCRRTLGVRPNTEAAIRAELADLTANPARENAPLNLTGASAAALHTALTDARIQLRKDKRTVWKHSSF
jgi:hypothetical protein